MSRYDIRELATGLAVVLVIAALLAGLWLAILAVRCYTADHYGREVTSAYTAPR